MVRSCQVREGVRHCTLEGKALLTPEGVKVSACLSLQGCRSSTQTLMTRIWSSRSALLGALLAGFCPFYRTLNYAAANLRSGDPFLTK